MKTIASNHSHSIFQSLSTLSLEQRQLFEILLGKQGGDVNQLKIPKRQASEQIPLSFSQQRVWSVSQLTPNAAIDNVAVGFHIVGNFNLQSFEQSVNVLIEQNEILRTTVDKISTGQTIKTNFNPWFKIFDLSGLPNEQGLEQAIQKANYIAQQPFNLIQDILFRTAIFCLGNNEFVLLLVTHQFVTDGLSLRFLLQEIATLYHQVLAGNVAFLSEPAIQYSDYAVWQRQWFTDSILGSQAAYWRNQLRGASPQLKLPIYQNCASPTYLSSSEKIHFSEHCSSRLRALCCEQGVTVFMALVAILQSVLHHCTLENDICIGTLISNRNRPEIERLIGNFSNNLLLRSTFSENLRFCDLLAMVRKSTLDAYSHQDLPFQNLLNSVDDLPKFQVLFIVRNSTTAQSLALPNLKVQDLSIDLGLTRMELNLDLTDDGKNPIFGKLEYKTELFEADTIKKLVRNLEALLEAVIEQPDQKIEDIELPETLCAKQDFEGATSAQFINIPKASHVNQNHAQPNSEAQRVYPQTDLEKTIAAIWSNVLSIEQVDIHANFFELGGNSLQAVHLFAEINKRLNKALPLSTLIQAPTVAKLADVIQQGEESVSWSPLVTIKVGDVKKVPLFCIHGGGFNVLIYRDLALRLETDQPVYGLQARGLDGEWLHDRLESMAADYIREIQAIRSEGPYMLAGLSNGGNIAFEMAQQLRAQGQEVLLLAMFDTYGPESVKLLPPIPRFLCSIHYLVQYGFPRYVAVLSESNFNDLMYKFRVKLGMYWKKLNQSKQQNNPSDHAQRSFMAEVRLQKENPIFSDLHSTREPNSFEQLLNRISYYILRHSPWAFFTPSSQLQEMDDEISVTLKRLDEHYIEVQKDYNPKPYAGKITLFKAKEFPPGCRVDSKLGWSNLAREGVEVYKIPGHHTSIMGSELLAEKLQSCIGRAVRGRDL
jgi:thioesterase domain-containing protein/acyl carrier protein